MEKQEKFDGGGHLMTPKELAAYLKVSTRTVQKLTSDGLIPCVRVGTKLPRYDVKDVVEALECLRRARLENN